MQQQDKKHSNQQPQEPNWGKIHKRYNLQLCFFNKIYELYIYNTHTLQQTNWVYNWDKSATHAASVIVTKIFAAVRRGDLRENRNIFVQLL